MSEQFVRLNPATGVVESSVDAVSDAEVATALAASAQAYAAWRQVPLDERIASMRRLLPLLAERRTALAEIASAEMGKKVAEAEGELDYCISIVEFYCDNAADFLADQPTVSLAGRALIRKEPLGPLLGVMPWNFPFYQVFRFAVPNLLAGNTVVVKPATQCPDSSRAIQALFDDAGFPAGAYINLFATHSQIETVIGDERIVGISLTGSERAGSRVAELAGKHLKKVVLELGGSDPYLFLRVDDLATAVREIARVRLGNSGQACNAAKRFVVIDEIYDNFVALMSEAFAERRPGDPRDADAGYGPMSSAAALAGLEAQVDDALAHGARAVTGGARSSEVFGAYEPTLLVDVPPTARAFREELFGPVSVVYRAADVDEAVRIANHTSYGLGAAVYHDDVDIALTIANRLDAGMVFINAPELGGPELPFGGIKRSGYGRELGSAGMDEFVNKKLIHYPSA